MKKCFKRLIAGVVSLALATTMVFTSSGDVSAASKLPAGMSKVNKKKLTIVANTSDVNDKVKAFNKKYPQYADLLEVITLDLAGAEYQTAVDKLVKEKKVDIIYWSNDLIGNAINSSYTVPMSKIGFKKSWYKNAYPYTITTASKKEKLMAVTDMVQPGCFVYNKKLAKKAFGTSDPDKIQAKISNWSKFISATKQAAKKKIKLVAGETEIREAFIYGNSSTYVKNGSFQLPKNFNTYYKVRKALIQNDFSNDGWKYYKWSEGWLNGFNNGNILGYFGCPWFYYTMKNNYLPVNTKEWGIVAGPAAYTWSDSYFTATKYCDNKGLAQLFLYTITCDTNYQINFMKNKLYVPNNSTAVQKLIKKGVGKFAYANDPYVIFDQVAKKTKGKPVTKYDYTIFQCLISDSDMLTLNKKNHIPSYKKVCNSLKKQVQKATGLK